MTSLPRRRTQLALVAALAMGSSAGARAQAEPRGTSIVIVTGQQATTPVPTLMEGAANSVGNLDVVDQLFLRLVELGPKLVTSGDRDFVPGLARSWSRRDSTTLVFDLDPRARWHDGVPVTARDVVFTFGRAKNPDISPRVSDLLRQITSVTAEGELQGGISLRPALRRAVVRCHLPCRPDSGPPAGFHSARFRASLELRYQPDRQRPVSVGTQRAGAVCGAGGGSRLLSGQTEDRPGHPPHCRRAGGSGSTCCSAARRMPWTSFRHSSSSGLHPDITLASSVPSSTMGYLLFNQHDPKNRARPHPILADNRVRRAITLAIDRGQLVQAVFGSQGMVPYGPVSQMLWIRQRSPRAEGPNISGRRAGFSPRAAGATPMAMAASTATAGRYGCCSRSPIPAVSGGKWDS